MGPSRSTRHAVDERHGPGSRIAAARVAQPISVVLRPIDALSPDPANARQHSKKQIRQIAKSIEAFGFNVPVLVDAQLNVIAGHGRLLACRALGWTEVPTITLTHLNEAQAGAFAIADNRLTEIARWDDRLLAEQLKALSLVELDFDLEATGFEIGEIDLRIGTLQAETSSVKNPAELASQPPISKEGDLWLLGVHRVLCGSLLDPQAYQLLMGAKRATTIVTDSPACVDAIIQRWQALTGKGARHAESGQFYDERADASETTDAS